MNIVNATHDHIDYISNSLVQYFSKANRFFEYPKYKDTFDIMQKHVSRRIEEGDGGFVYFVAEDAQNNPVGFINVLINEFGVGSILASVADNKETHKELINKAMEYFKENNVTNVQGEVFDYESDLKEILSELGVKYELLSFKLSI